MATRDKGRGGNRGGNVLGQKPRPNKTKEPVYVRDDTPRMSAPRPVEKSLPQINKRLGEFTIERWSHDGRGLTSLNGKTVFIQGALPGEKVSARLVEEHPRFIEARIDELIQASPDRVAPPCIYYHECGGCQLQHITPSAQLMLKQEVLLQQLQHWGKVTPKRILAPIHTGSEGYRSRARLGVWYEPDGRVSLGFRQQHSKKITPIQSCLVLVPELDALIKPVQMWLETLQSKSVTHVELVRGEGQSAIVLRHTKSLSQRDRDGLRLLATQKGCAVWLEPNGRIGLTDVDGTPADPRLNYSVGQVNIQFHPQDFTQVNPRVNSGMVAQAMALLELKPDDKVLDLFCGVGNFTLPLARHCAGIIGVEGADTMVNKARDNASISGIANATFVTANLADTQGGSWQALLKREAPSAILLDPPRDGAKEVINAIADGVHAGQLSPTRIVYVSCNPATLARDAAILAEVGYTLDAAGILDMFPHTSHVESMALFLLK